MPLISKVVASHADDCWVDCCCCCTDLYSAGGAQVLLPMGVGSATSQLDLPSLMPLSVAGCGRLQLGIPNWATSADYSKLLIIYPTFCGSIFFIGRHLAAEDFTCIL